MDRGLKVVAAIETQVSGTACLIIHFLAPAMERKLCCSCKEQREIREPG